MIQLYFWRPTDRNEERFFGPARPRDICIPWFGAVVTTRFRHKTIHLRRSFCTYPRESIAPPLSCSACQNGTRCSLLLARTSPIVAHCHKQWLSATSPSKNSHAPFWRRTCRNFSPEPVFRWDDEIFDCALYCTFHWPDTGMDGCAFHANYRTEIAHRINGFWCPCTAGPQRYHSRLASRHRRMENPRRCAAWHRIKGRSSSLLLHL